MSLKALILAGGLGERMGHPTLPKPMVPVNGKPFLEHQILYLRHYGITNIVLCVGHLAEKIEEYFGDGGKLKVNIKYSREDKKLGTFGALRNAARYIDCPFLLLNGDDYWNVNLSELIEFHKKSGLIGTIVAKRVSDSSEYGCLVLDGDKVSGWREKGVSGANPINAGLYVLERSVLEQMQNRHQNLEVSLEREVLPELARQGLLGCFRYEGYFIDLVNQTAVDRFCKDIKERKVEVY